jgi:hypothetical protein
VETADWVPDDVDTTVPSAARVYDFLLGGGHHFAADRTVGKAVLDVQPQGREIARSNRAFLGRAVRYLIDQGITQFLDLGSGIPTVGNVHEVAQKAHPQSRIVYVDNDQVAVAHSQLMLQGNENAAVINADLRTPDAVLNAPELRKLLDFTKPIGLLTVAVFHFVADSADPAEIMARYVAALPAGSFVALSHLTADQMPGEMAGVVEAMRNSRNPMYFRRHDEVAALFAGLEMVEPGLVTASRWRNDGWGDAQEGVYAGIGRKP